VAMGRVQQFKREGKPLGAGWAVDSEGNPTTDPAKAVALMPFGQHKGYGLGLIDELYGAYIGGGLPQIRGTSLGDAKEKRSSTFYFQVIHPDALKGNDFARGRDQKQNVKAIIGDILGHGNEKCMLPGQPEANWGGLSKKYSGLLFTAAEIGELNHVVKEIGETPWNLADLKSAQV
jgi:ureidoglycolate dehydrogenase (NAD+)